MSHNLTKTRSFYPPIIVNTSNAHYLVLDGKWMEVPTTFTLEDGYKYWIRGSNTASKNNVQNATSKTWKVPNSKNTGHYTVTVSNSYWSCDCVGFGFRRDCKHIQTTKTKYNDKNLR